MHSTVAVGADVYSRQHCEDMDTRMEAPQKLGASNPVATPPIPTPLRGIQIAGSTKAGDRLSSNLQRSFLNVHLAMVRTEGMLTTLIKPSRGGVVVSLGVPTMLQSVLTTTSQGEKPNWAGCRPFLRCGRSSEGASRSIWSPQNRLGVHLRCIRHPPGLLRRSVQGPS